MVAVAVAVARYAFGSTVAVEVEKAVRGRVSAVASRLSVGVDVLVGVI